MRALTVIAIIDDNDVIREGLDLLVSASGYHTELYASAEEFLAKVTQCRASCLLVDVDLGGISGIELARQLAAEGFAFPTIFVTGSGNETHFRQAMELGCVAFLQKPVETHRLLGFIAEAVTQR
jgi:FixJ family two-component response regulator